MLELATKSERLRWARINAGFPSAAQAARRLGVPYGTYTGHENGLRGVKESELERYAKAFGVTVVWLIYGHEEEELDNQLVSYFAIAGLQPRGKLDGVVESMDTDWLTYPKFFDRPSSYIIVGSDLARGIADNGWHITIDRNFTQPTDEHIECLCVSKIKHQGYYLGKIYRGRKPNRYDIEFPMLETMRDRIIEKISPVTGILTEFTVRELKKINKDKKNLFQKGIDFDQ